MIRLIERLLKSKLLYLFLWLFAHNNIVEGRGHGDSTNYKIYIIGGFEYNDCISVIVNCNTYTITIDSSHISRQMTLSFMGSIRLTTTSNIGILMYRDRVYKLRLSKNKRYYFVNKRSSGRLKIKQYKSISGFL